MHLNDSVSVHFTTLVCFYPLLHIKEIKKIAELLHVALKNNSAQ